MIEEEAYFTEGFFKDAKVKEHAPLPQSFTPSPCSNPIIMAMQTLAFTMVMR
ncbi:hypothetical protein MASR2M78_28360 [Treponema sp.]